MKFVVTTIAIVALSSALIQARQYETTPASAFRPAEISQMTLFYDDMDIPLETDALVTLVESRDGDVAWVVNDGSTLRLRFVPEPTGFALQLAALISLAGLARRRPSR